MCVCACVCVCGRVCESVPSRGGISQLVSGTLAKPDSHTFGIVWVVFQICIICGLTSVGREGSCFALVSDKPLMFKKRAVSDLTICSWNIRSLLEISGDIRISRRDSPPSSSIVDRKLDLSVGELERWNICGRGTGDQVVWL